MSLVVLVTQLGADAGVEGPRAACVNGAVGLLRLSVYVFGNDSRSARGVGG